MPVEGATLEERFWAKVWRCTHRQPCKKCCWPWRGIALLNWRCTWQQHAVFSDKALGVCCVTPAHRFAYDLSRGTLGFRGHGFALCHQCDFGPCCNPSHLCGGSRSDNSKEARRPRKPIHLPDGQYWVFEEACVRQKAFYEACRYQRIWAGDIPAIFQGLAAWSDRPSCWPGRWQALMATAAL